MTHDFEITSAKDWIDRNYASYGGEAVQIMGVPVIELDKEYLERLISVLMAQRMESDVRHTKALDSLHSLRSV